MVKLGGFVPEVGQEVLIVNLLGVFRITSVDSKTRLASATVLRSGWRSGGCSLEGIPWDNMTPQDEETRDLLNKAAAARASFYPPQCDSHRKAQIMENKGPRGWLSATALGLRPGRFPLGSAQSRAAARPMAVLPAFSIPEFRPNYRLTIHASGGRLHEKGEDTSKGRVVASHNTPGNPKWSVGSSINQRSVTSIILSTKPRRKTPSLERLSVD
jgi:hypothetical protein